MSYFVGQSDKVYNAIVIEDENVSMIMLVNMVKFLNSLNVKITGTAKNLAEGIELIKLNRPDIVFLDIELPGEKGFAIYDYFKKPDFKIIFVTSHEGYAVDALKKSASAYLVKPINMVDMKESLQKVITQIEWEHQQNELIDRINYLSSCGIDGVRILFDVESGFIMENTGNIEYCVASQSYCQIFTIANKEILVSKSIKEIQDLLPSSQFYRTHKSYLVNINFIRKFVRAKESYLLLKSGTKIPVSVRVSSVISKEIKQMLLKSH